MGTNLKPTEDLARATQDLVDQYKRTGDINAFSQGLGNLQQAFTPLDESVQKSKDLVEKLQEKEDELTGRTYWVVINTRVNGDLGDGGGGDEDFGDRRALGGPVMAAQPYMVGERGPELFVPRQNGQIIPNNKLSAMSGNTYNLNVYTTQSTQVVQQGFQTLQTLAGV